MNLVQRARLAVAKAISPVQNVPPNWPIGWFQQGIDRQNTPYSGNSSVVSACVKAYAETVAQCPAYHYRIEPDGSRTILWDSPVTKLLEKPNGYQTRSDFMLNLVNFLYYQGNAYWVGDGATGRTHTQIHLLDPRQTRAHRVADTGDVFYSTGGEFAEHAELPQYESGRIMIPQRFIGHLRLFTPSDPLVGVTPIQDVAASIGVNNAIVSHQSAFFTNMTRPSGVLSTDLTLTKEQMATLRQAWEEQSKGLNAGGVPILSAGLKWDAMSMSAHDAEMVEAWKMSIEDISRVFRVPLMLINRMEESTFQNAETMMQFWLASGLGFLVDHIELTMKGFFTLPPNHGVHLDTEALLRSDTASRYEALGTGVTKGILSPNEARAREGLPPVEGGDEPRVQQQMVGLSWTPDEDQGVAPVNEPEDNIDEQTAALVIFLAKSAVREEIRNAA